MAAIGLKEGDTIALMMRNEPTLMDVMLAARQLGLYFTPLNWHFKSEEADTLCAIAVRKRCSFTLICFSKLRMVSHLTFPFLRCDHIHSRSLPTTFKSRQDGFRMEQVTGRRLLLRRTPYATSATIPRGMIAYTSGTTGRPKGVRRFPPSPEEASAFAERMAQMFQRALGLTPDARCLISAPLYHSAPCVSSLMMAQFGAWLRLEPKFDAQSTLSTIERLRVTHPYLVPTMYVRLLRLPKDVRYNIRS